VSSVPTALACGTARPPWPGSNGLPPLRCRWTAVGANRPT
jgi:hypothetical protein